MKSKTVWNVTDASPVIAWESPLEKGVYHHPAYSVEVKPPQFNPDSQTCSWDGFAWVITEKVIPQVEEWVAPPEPEEYVVPANELPEYIFERTQEYGMPHEQLEFITENGLKAWQSKVAEIKKKYPKG